MQAADATMTITFRGVRGSHPMPGPTTLRYGGNTTCQEIRVGGRLIVFDTGTGVIGLGHDLAEDNQSSHEMAVFFSHNHHDHIGGLLYFKPAYMQSTVMHIFGPSDELDGDILNALEMLSQPAAHPVQLARMGMRYDCTVLHGGERVLWRPGEDKPRLAGTDETTTPEDVVVRVLKNGLHPLEGVLNFRLEYGGKSYVYASDVEGDETRGDAKLAEFARGADLMAHDGQYTSEEYAGGKTGWGHSTIRMAVKTAEMAGIGRLAIIHHDPMHSDDQLDDMEQSAKELWPNLFFAHEGQTITL